MSPHLRTLLPPGLAMKSHFPFMITKVGSQRLGFGSQTSLSLLSACLCLCVVLRVFADEVYCKMPDVLCERTLQIFERGASVCQEDAYSAII
jgi:hypothetical protein